MAIEPIKGFYVHDEATDTDGVAQYDAGALENLDRSLTERYRAPDSKAVGDRLSAVEAVADEANEIAERLNEGGLELKDEVLAENISAWLNEHPEATTTVEDGALVQSKLSDSLDARKPSFYSTVSEMQEDEQLRLGTTAISDGAVYTVRSAVEVNDPEDMVDPSVLYKYDGQYYHGGLTEDDREIATGFECASGFALFVAEYKNAYVTPEMFGAKGDGIADDTKAWQKAVDVGLPVIAKSAQYKCGTINVTKNISIDCNNAEFVCTSEYLFKPSGELVTTLIGENDYTAGQKNYTISNSNYSNYSGFAMIRGTNNWNPLRTYYLGGMVGFFANGIFLDSMPIDVTGISIDIINPVTCDIRNINGVTFSGTHDGKIIYCSYGVNCNFENIATNKECYHVVCFYRCYQCTAAGISAVLPPYTGSASNIYPIACLDTCYTITKDSTIYNPFWHAWTTGQAYLCIGNIVDNCVMKCDNNHAIEDHQNAIGTIIRNTTASQIGLAQGAVVENVTITSTNDTDANCELQFGGSPIEDLAVYTAKNITFEPSDDCQSLGVCLRSFSQTTGNTVYYKSVDIVDTFYNNKNVANHASHYVYTSPPAGIDEIIIKKITIDNTNMRCNMWDANVAKLNFDNAIITIKNCKSEHPPGVSNKHIVVTLAKNANITIENSKLYWLSGNKAKTLTFCNVEVYGASISPSSVLCNGTSLVCAGLDLRGCENVLLHNVLQGSAYFDKIWRLGLANDIYATRLFNSIDPVNITFQTAQ